MSALGPAARRAAAAIHGFLVEPGPRVEAGQEQDQGRAEGAKPAEPDRGPEPPVILTTAIGASGGAASFAAAVGVAAAGRAGGRCALLIDVAPPPRPPGPTVLASASARALEERIRALGGRFDSAAARGHLCYLSLPGGDDPLGPVVELLELALPASVVIVHVPQALWPRAIAEPRLGARAGLMRADLPDNRAIAALAVGELHEHGLRAKLVSDPLGRVASRRALAGMEPGGAASRGAGRLARGLLAGQSGQSLPLVLGAAAALIFTAVVLTAIGGAVTGKARAQRAADLAALSGARSMRDDFDRLFAPALRADGSPNPAHLSKAEYLAHARAAARNAARRNEVPPTRLRVRFPDAGSFAPLRVRARVAAELDREALPGPGGPGATGRRRDIPVVAGAEAEASPPASWSGMPTMASGGGYSGPLAYRQGKPMRPDVAQAFDRMAAAARRDGISLLITSAFRSDAEQAELFAQNPDPTWVAPPGKSLHRCATELDLGPATAYGWLARNASRFGFLKRYSWEPWHYGYRLRYCGGAPDREVSDEAVGSARARQPHGRPQGEQRRVPRRS